MNQTIPILLVTGALVLSMGCGKKKLGDSAAARAAEEEREREAGLQNDDVTQGRTTDIPTKRLPK